MFGRCAIFAFPAVVCCRCSFGGFRPRRASASRIAQSHLTEQVRGLPPSTVTAWPQGLPATGCPVQLLHPTLVYRAHALHRAVIGPAALTLSTVHHPYGQAGQGTALASGPTPPLPDKSAKTWSNRHMSQYPVTWICALEPPSPPILRHRRLVPIQVGGNSGDGVVFPSERLFCCPMRSHAVSLHLPEQAILTSKP